MNDGDAYHYPPELFSLLVDTIPLLCRSKKDLITFFRGAGMTPSMTVEVDEQLSTDRASLNKYEMTRQLLTALNEGGDRTLATRRQVLRRVVEYEDFSGCWPNDQLRAAGLVAQIQKIVNVKDSFTRMSQARQEAADQAKTERESQLAAERQKALSRQTAIDDAKRRLFALFQVTDPHKRGKQLEAALNALFSAYGILIAEDFRRTGGEGGVVEQVDGVIEIDHELLLVEMKWWSDKIGHAELAPHLNRLMLRSGVSGLFLSSSDYTPSAIEAAEVFLNHRMLVLSTVEEIVALLERGDDLVEFIRKKIRAARLNRMAFKKIL